MKSLRLTSLGAPSAVSGQRPRPREDLSARYFEGARKRPPAMSSALGAGRAK